MTPEKFKRSDPKEQKIDDVFAPVMDQVGQGLDAFYAAGYNSAPWLLQLYDTKRVPFADRIGRDAFVPFIREALQRFPVIGTFDTHLFILWAIFGLDSEITFTVPIAGVLNIDVNATSSLEFEWVGYDDEGTFEIVDESGEAIVFRGIAGIETQEELELLFAEILPGGISPHFTLTFFSLSDWIAEYSADTYDDMVDGSAEQLIFKEIGGI